MQQPDPHLPSVALETERAAPRGGVQDRLVDDVVVAVPAADALEAFYLQLAEESSIEGGYLRFAADRSAGASGNVVLALRGEFGDDRLDVTRFLGAEVVFDQRVHLLAGHAGHLDRS